MYKLLTTVLLAMILNVSYAQHKLFTIEDTNGFTLEGTRKIIPQKYILAKLDVATFKNLQFQITKDENSNDVLIQLPTPNGEIMNFRIFEAPMMEQPLYNKYPEIKTYTAIHTEDKFITAKIDFTLWGFHAMVFDGENTFFIDPYTDATQTYYSVYYKKDYYKPLNERMHCDVTDETLLDNSINIDNDLPAMNKNFGVTKRVYRLALACTVEYSAAVGGATPTKASVLSAMVTSMNRVNGVFEREFAMHENLIANNDTLIYIGTVDPYTNNTGSTMLGENQTNVNTIIGTANYDHGHVFSTGGGGIASLGSYCGNNKAQGVTGSSNPVGDPFDIDYVAHEMGHQLGGSHTFNSISGSCSGNRSGTSAYEIGSGTTIMAYAGICGGDDIQPHSDDFYTIRSLNQISTFLAATGNSCATKTTLTNKPPYFTIPILSKDTIPYLCPFELKVSGSDTDANPLKYCWEQYNRGGSGSAWNAVTTYAPIFKSFNPTSDSNRTFPTTNELLKNKYSYLGEILPVNARTLTFKCTIRDINNGYGAFNYSDDSVNLYVMNTGADTFKVTSQSTAVTYNGNSSQIVTWNIASTNVTPINTSMVDIYVTVDSGKTYLLVKANTPNDGTEVITIPNIATSFGRIKVKGHDNVFFDLNNNWVTITKVADPAAISTINKENISLYPNPTENGSITIKNTSQNKISKILINNILGQTVYTIDKLTSSSITISNIAKGLYTIKIVYENNNQYLDKFIVK